MTEPQEPQEPQDQPTPEEQVLEAAEEILAGAEKEFHEPTDADRLVERTQDLQRLQAEYANYRKRVERDKSVARENGVGEVFAALLPLLDDFARADEHGELTGAFKSVSDNFTAVLAKFNVEMFGEEGEEFDPELHEALVHEPSELDGETKTVVANVYQRGYRYAGRVLRPARVVVRDVTAL